MKISYIAIDQSGNKQKGVTEANNEKEVVDYLKLNNLTPIKVKEVKKIQLYDYLPIKRVHGSDIIIFTRQLSSMTMTGLTLLESLNILKQQASNPQMQEVINGLIEDISEGKSFSQALTKRKDVFSEVYISLIKAAEAGGLLDKVLGRLADNLEKSDDMRKRVRGALLYPGIIICGVVGVVIIMNIFVIPQLGKLYTDMNVQLPLPTQIVLGMSSFVVTFLPVLIFVPILLYIAFLRFKKTEIGIRTMDRIKLNLPVYGSIVTLSILDEISRTLSLLISSGSSIIDALDTSANVSDNIWYKDAINSSSQLVEKGVTLSSAFQQYPELFPMLVIQMIKVGESTGKIDESLLKASQYFERDLDIKVKTLTTSIEPILILVLGIVVAFLIISIITPIYGLVSTIGS